MIVTFLGTGTSQGVPVIACKCNVCSSIDFRDKRFRTSVHLAVDNKSFVIDSGPDFRSQILREKIDRMDALLFTHQHKDHTAGMDDIRSFNFKQRKDMPIYASTEVLDQLKAEFSYIFQQSKYPGLPRVEVNIIENKPFSINDVHFIPIEVMHYKLPVFGYRVEDFVYITDANYISPKEKEKIKGAKVLVLNALQKEKHISHYNLEEALELIEELKPGKAYLTHISHRMGRHADVSSELPDNVEIAYDGLRITI